MGLEATKLKRYPFESAHSNSTIRQDGNIQSTVQQRTRKKKINAYSPIPTPQKEFVKKGTSTKEN